MDLSIFLPIVCSALIHASWNVAVRHLKGSTPAIVFGHFFGALMLTPIVVWMSGEDVMSIFQDTGTLQVLGLSMLAHQAYLLLLASAYQYGEVGLVYPLARGTAIVLTTSVSILIGIDTPLTNKQYYGVGLVVAGLAALALDALAAATSADAAAAAPVEYSSLPVVEEDEESHVEMVSSSREEYDDHNNDNDSDLDDEDLSDFNGVREDVSEAISHAVSKSYSSSPPKKKRNTDDEDEARSGTGAKKDGAAAVAGSRSKILMSIGLAMIVGTCTSSYSIIDSQGVKMVSPLVFMMWLSLLQAGLLIPVMLWKYPDQTSELFAEHKRSLLFVIAPGTITAYLIILYVFSLPNIHLGLVVCMREFSVLFGSIFGVVLLGERCGMIKFAAIMCILLGMITLKVA